MPHFLSALPTWRLAHQTLQQFSHPQPMWGVLLGATLAVGLSQALAGSLNGGWIALLEAGMPAEALQKPLRPFATLGWGLSMLACVAWALWQAAKGPAITGRLALLAGSCGSAVLVLAVLGRGFSAADVTPMVALAALAGGLCGRLLFARWQIWSDLQFAQRQRQAEERLNVAKSEFLNQLSGELRGPLHTVIGVADLIHETALNADQKRHMAVFQRAAAALSSTLDDVDELSRLESGRVALQNSDVALIPLIHNQIAQIRQEAESKGVQVQLLIAPDAPRRIHGDAQRLGRVLAHMLNHSVKSTRQGHIRLELRPNARDTRTLRFVVTDTSLSPISGKLALLLAPFADATHERARHSAAVGLTLARSTASLMGGKLSVRHSAGRGTTMIFSATMQPADENASPDTPATPPVSKVLSGASTLAPQSIGVSFSTKSQINVLLADDNVSTSELIASMLHKDSYNVVRCSNGREALQALEVAPFDIVLMDLHMPVLDGMSAVRMLRRLEKEKHLRRTPVIALGDAPFDLERQRCLDAGFDQHLCKPLRKSRLLESIAFLIKVAASEPKPAPTLASRTQVLRYEQRDALGLLANNNVIDVETALRDLGGDATIFLDAIEQLTPALSNWPTRFRDTLNRGETERAIQMAHDMRSILQVVHALPCAACLGRVAEALAHPNPDTTQQSALLELEQQMGQLLRALQNAVDRLKTGRADRAAANSRGQNTPM